MWRAAQAPWLGALLLFVGCADSCEPPTPDAGPPVVDAGPQEGSIFDPLSMPEAPTLSIDNFAPAVECGQCHTRHYQEWRTSMHAYAMVDPVYRAMVAVRRRDQGSKQDRFCVQCHSAIATRGGEIVEDFRFEDLSEVALDGVTCEACHKVTDVVRPYNAGHVLDEFSAMRGPIADPVESGYHASEHTTLLGSPRLCGSCHDVVERSGLDLERPFAEWSEAPPGSAKKTCQSCHMPEYEGQAAEEGPVREQLHSHRFIGVDLPLTDDFVSPEELARMRHDVRRLLSGAASVRLHAAPAVARGQQLDLYVDLKNHIEAHNLPTGSTFIRQLWLEVTATDAEGNVVYRTGHLDDNGDLRDYFSELDPYGDDDLIRLSSVLVNESGAPEIFSHRATEHISNSLSPLYERTYTLFLPTAEAAPGPLTVRARLRFRTHGPYLLRALGLEDKVERLEIYDLDADEEVVEVVGD